ncbi:unnamed protein product [Microthlaspi erraticum]|uniref:Transcription factor TFIIB cyclin-like domain-containing protein n=1 Tax=Microthlaspi erraticum TaxID=1685480 RepID=A0A6D2KUK6_9BRAS|nr:unnamed protein product [Microthlaspi erraticum]
MWTLHECCSGIVVDWVARNTSCSNCGFDFGLSTVTTDPNDFLLLTHGDSQHRGSETVSIVTTETKNSSDLPNSQSRSLNSLAIATTEPEIDPSDDILSSDHRILQSLGPNRVSIADMSNRLRLLATIKTQANEIFIKVEKKSRKKDRNAFFAACIYIACRQTDMTRSIREICSVANGATVSNISKAIGVIAETLNIDKIWLMQIKATDFIKRFCSTLGMDGQAVKAAQEAARSYECVNRSSSPVSVAAVVVYAVAQIYDDKLLLQDITNANGVPKTYKDDKLLLEDIAKATGVQKATIRKTYKDLYPHLSTILIKWFAEAEDLKMLASP